MAINLLPQEFRGTGKVQALGGALGKTSAVLLILYLVALISILGALLFFSRQKNAVVSENETLEGRVQELVNSEGLVNYLKNRVRLAKGVFAESQTPDLMADRLVNILPEGMQIIETRAERGAVNIILRTVESSSVVELMDRLEDENFTSVVLISLNMTSSGDYAFSLEVR